MKMLLKLFGIETGYLGTLNVIAKEKAKASKQFVKAKAKLVKVNARIVTSQKQIEKDLAELKKHSIDLEESGKGVIESIELYDSLITK